MWSVSQENGELLLETIILYIQSIIVQRKWLEQDIKFPTELSHSGGIYVSMNKGDITISSGYPFSDKPLIESAFEAACNVAIRTLSNSGLEFSGANKYTIFVDILSPLYSVKVERKLDYLKIVDVHKGLFIERGFYKGLVLPRFALEKRWNVDDYLSECCLRAGLAADSWLNYDINVYQFNTQELSSTLSF
ncbi:MAG: AMMECR1 domain-containing protein [Nitrososphaeria archaeon]|jgi:uncharacterized protein (TIGR00296 family)